MKLSHQFPRVCESASAIFLPVLLSATDKPIDVIPPPSASDGL